MIDVTRMSPGVAAEAMWWRKASDKYTDAEIELVVASGDVVCGCEAFLTGTYREYTVGRGLPVPSWAWLSRLAHGSGADLQRIADEEPRGSSPGWLVHQIARHMLTLIHERGLALPDLQRGTLIPLELALAAGSSRPYPVSSTELGRAITDALSGGMSPLQHRSNRQGEC